jgi:trans-AT polyketide synthase/acyltransferase/oxidoreductase domain-containing protein
MTPERLGSESFKQDYGLRLAYVAGAMVKAIASVDLVVRMGRAGCLAFYGSGGMKLDAVDLAVQKIQQALAPGEPYGVNLLSNPSRPDDEMRLVDLLLRRGVRNAEASAYLEITPAIVKFRLQGLSADAHGKVVARNRVIAKISRPEIAARFLAPAPQPIVARLHDAGAITAEEAALAAQVPVASDICVEADSGGHTDMGVMSVLLPAIIRLRDRAQAQYPAQAPVHIGAAGGVGTPEAIACAFLLGADFVATGSINQCSVESGTSATVKDMLQAMGVQDTAYAPAGDMFEMGSKIQVMKKGVFFPAKASKLYDLWRNYPALEQIDAATQRELQDKYFRRSFEDVYQETRAHYQAEAPEEIARAERLPKARMALVFRWYFVHTMRLALAGDPAHRVDYQVHTGPALGAFNQWVQGTAMEDWRQRHVDAIATHLMGAGADYLTQRLRRFS